MMYVKGIKAGARQAQRAGYLHIARTSQNMVGFAARGFATVLATDDIDDLCVKIFEERGHKVHVHKTRPEAELIKVIGDYDGLVVRSATKVTPAVLKAATKLRIIGRAGVGVDNINVPEATKHGVMVMNTPGGNTVSTAQLALSLLCSLARHVPQADMSVKEGKWEKKPFMGVELSGKTLGIIGCGRIGQVVANSAQIMGMNVIGYDPVMSSDTLKELGIAPVDKTDDIWKHSDFITLHTPLTPETNNLLNDETFAKCKTGVRIINCARGGIVDEAALLRALNSGKVAGAALDVFTSEPPREHLKPLIAHPNLVCTPHLGASTEEAQVNVARDIAVQMCDVFDQKDFVGICNVSYLAASTLPPMKPFMALAETLGTLQAQMTDSKPVSVELRTWGGRDVNITTKQARQLLEACMLKGLLKHMGLGLVPDMISAPIMAKEAGVQVKIEEQPPEAAGSPYWNLVSLDVKRADGTNTRVTGAVFGSTPHIVQVDQYKDIFAFKPEGSYILTFRNLDVPGAISEVLTILHNANINVANVTVARSPLNTTNPSKALCFMALDDDVPTNSLNALKKLTALTGVAKISLK